MKSMQMSKSVDAHQAEIRGLQRELTKSLDTIDDLERDLASERLQLAKVSKELKDRQKDDGAADIDRLERELRQRHDDLEVVLVLLQSKVEHIVELECAIQEANDKLRRYQDVPSEPNTSTELSAQLRESQAECKSLKRQNIMLKLLLEEQGSREQMSGEIDLDSFFRSVSCDVGSASETKEEPVNISDERGCASVSSSSALADDLFQKEIERFNLQGSSYSRCSWSRGKSPRNLCEC